MKVWQYKGTQLFLIEAEGKWWHLMRTENEWAVSQGSERDFVPPGADGDVLLFDSEANDDVQS